MDISCKTLMVDQKIPLIWRFCLFLLLVNIASLPPFSFPHNLSPPMLVGSTMNHKTSTRHTYFSMVLTPRPSLLSWGAGLSEAVHVLDVQDFLSLWWVFSMEWNTCLHDFSIQEKERLSRPEFLESPWNSNEKLSVVQNLWMVWHRQGEVPRMCTMW